MWIESDASFEIKKTIIKTLRKTREFNFDNYKSDLQKKKQNKKKIYLTLLKKDSRRSKY